jgi:hypothetical protein
LEWLNNYHELCIDKVGEELKSQGKLEVLEWLKREAAPMIK